MLVNDERIDKTSLAKYLGVFLDENVTLKNQIKSKCKTAMLNLQRIKSVRNILTNEACETLLTGLLNS